jgi:hypothetical protein
VAKQPGKKFSQVDIERFVAPEAFRSSGGCGEY